MLNNHLRRYGKTYLGVVAIVALCFFAAASASADVYTVDVCPVGRCEGGTTTVTFTQVLPSHVVVNVTGFTISPGLDGPGTSDGVFGGSIDLFGNGTASDWFYGGFAVSGVLPPAPYFWGILASTWSLSGMPGNMTLTISGPGQICFAACSAIGGPPTTGPSWLTITGANITTPTPEPSSLLLFGLGAAVLLVTLRRRRLLA